MKTKKPYGFWNWGTALVIVFILGASGIIFLVYQSQQMSAELVTENYYAEELKFQQKIDARTHANQLSDSVRIHDDGKGIILLAFPTECIGQSITGTIYCYNPSDSKKDYRTPISIDGKGLQVIQAQFLRSGSYLIQIEWAMNGKTFGTEIPFKKR
ncbi:FixH family protein [Taibaiella sp. KBW10]|uniref:FixH family protein n=1 Tax=Taibaiella sp. KBW10 TaxID=2153357 RepID=UPI00131527D8|nr:FixH family protein [Taibaiella sp. KBW10]